MALFHAQTVIAFMAASTRVKSAIAFGSASVVLTRPLQTPNTKPTGPLKLSIHPGTGSFHDDITSKKKKKERKSEINFPFRKSFKQELGLTI